MASGQPVTANSSLGVMTLDAGTLTSITELERHGQAWLRHGSAKTTLDTYGHLRPDKDESTKAVIDAVVDSKFQVLRTLCRLRGARRDAPLAQRPRKG
jgi:hypothetical protein